MGFPMIYIVPMIFHQLVRGNDVTRHVDGKVGDGEVNIPLECKRRGEECIRHGIERKGRDSPT